MVRAAVDTLGHLPALSVNPANGDDRSKGGDLIRTVQEGAGERVVKLPEARHGFALLPCRWVTERTFGWATRFRCLVKDYERLPETLAGFHIIPFVCLMPKNAAPIAGAGP